VSKDLLLKQLRRISVLGRIDGKLSVIRELTNQVGDLVDQIEGEWVLTKLNPSTGVTHYFCTEPAKPHAMLPVAATDSRVKVFQSPRDAALVASHIVFAASGPAIQVVDRLDGEVYVDLPSTP